MSDALLAALSGAGRVDADGVALVVAHPDDETIGMGGQLHRMAGVTLIHVTDGAPENPEPARARGFDTPAAYAAARRQELARAADLAGIPVNNRIALGMTDQRVSFQLAELARRLADIVAGRGLRAIFTHPYEGGHPDHDATALAVHAAAALCGRQGGAAPALYEMTFYHAGPEGLAVEHFPAAAAAPEIAITLDAASLDMRARMVAAHASQAKMLAQVEKPVERFRRSPSYDFTVLPNGGALNYAGRPWGMSGERWLALTRDALRALDLAPVL